MVELGGQISPDIQLRLNNPVPVDGAARPVRRRRSRVALGGGQPNVNIDNVGNSRDGADLFDDLFNEEDSAENTNLNAESTPIVDAVDLSPNIEVTPVPTQHNILKTVQFMVVSALGAHEKAVTYRDGLGREKTNVMKSKDVYVIEQNDFAQRRLQEAKEVWDPSSIEGLNGFQRFGKTLERTLSRVWRGMGAEDAHLKKEMAQGVELSKIAGIDTAVSEEFFSVIENKAKARIKTERNSKPKQLWGKVKDAWAEFSATNGDLHKYELDEARELRRKYDANPANPDPVENPLYALVNRDVSAREALAARLNENDMDIITQTNAKDKKTKVAIRLEGEKGLKVQEYLKKEILEKIIDDYTTRLTAKENVTGISAKLRRESDIKLQNYFMTAEFQDWVKTLPVEQQAMFENSFTYASDLLLQTEEGLLPAVKENLAHYKSADKLKFDMELSLGTAQLSANTESVKDGWFSKERKSLNQKLMDQMRGERNTTPTSHLYDTQVIHNGVVKDRMMGYVSSIVKNEGLAAWLGALTVKGSLTLARKGLSWAPTVGGAALAGTASGLKEWARMGKHRETFGFGKANGLEFPVAANAVKSAELNSADYHRIQIGDRTQQLLESANKFKDGTADVNTAFMTMVYDADSTARLKLNGERNINLMTATVNGPEGRGVFARELRSHDHARSVARVRLNEYLADEGRRNEIATLMGVPADQPRDTAALMDRLVNLQYNNLLSGVKVDAALAAAISSKDGKVILEESQSIRARDKIFNGLRIKSTVKYAATSSVIAGVAGWGLGRVFNNAEDIAGGHETYNATLVDHSLPSVTDHIPTSTITDDHGNVIVQTFSHVPAGTHLVETQLRVGGPDDFTTGYNLVADNAADKVLLHNISFGDHGQILNQADLQEEMLANHITLSPQNLHPVGWEADALANGSETTSLVGATKDLTVGDLPGFNEQGWSGWFHHTMSADGNTPSDAELNAVVKTFRGFEIWEQNDGSNVVNEYPNRIVHFKDLNPGLFGDHKDVVAAAQSDTAVFKGIPHLWSTAEGHETIAKTFEEAQASYEATETFTDEAHRIIYEAGIGGEEGVPDASEMKVLLEYFGNISGEPGTATETVTTTINPVEYWFNMSDDVVLPVPVPPGDVFTQTVPGMLNHLVAAGYSHPLEAAKGNIKTQEPDNYQRKGKGKGSGIEKRPDATVEKGVKNEESASFIRPVLTPTIIGTPKRVLDNNEDENQANDIEGSALRPDDPNEEPSLKIDNELDDAIAKLAMELDGKDTNDESDNDSENVLEEKKRKELSGKIILDEYTKFIPKLREELKSRHGDREDWTKTPDQAWLSDRDLIHVADKYNLPLAFMRRYMYNGAHFIVLVKPPEKISNDRYIIDYYDPKADGIQSEVINLNDLSNEYNKVYLSNGARSGEVANSSLEGDDVIDFMTNAKYDLTIPEAANKKYLVKSLTSKTQVGPDSIGDGHNCGPLILAYAAQAAALRDKIKKDEVKKWEDDYGYTLLKKEILS